MSSDLFTKLGLGSLDLGIVLLVLIVLVIALLVLVIWQIKQLRHLNDRYRKFMQGTRPRSMETQIQELIKTVNDLQVASLDQQNEIRTLFQRMETTFQKMGLIKYDAYKEMGGKLSYGLAVLDENNNGFLINSVHTSTGCYSYTKRIRKGKCNIELSPEEQEALNRAMVGTAGGADENK